MRCATVYLHAVFFICPFKQSAMVSGRGGGSAINVWVIWRNKLTWNRWRTEEGCWVYKRNVLRAWQYVSSERRCLMRGHLSALMGWCNCPSLPRWPGWSERRALMMLNYVNIILNWLFNEVSGFADQRTRAKHPPCAVFMSVRTLNTLTAWSHCLAVSLTVQLHLISFDVWFLFLMREPNLKPCVKS